MNKGKKLHPPWYRAGFGGFCDCFGSGLQTFALFFIPPSIYSIGKNAVVIFTAIFSTFYLKKPLFRHQKLAILVVMIGFIMVALSTICFPAAGDNSKSHTFNFNSVIGIICLFLSLIFQGFCYCYQEGLLDKYEVNVMQMIGFESMVGAVVSSVIMVVVTNITCVHPEFCNAEMGFPIDSPPGAFHDLRQNNALLIFILCTLSIMIFNLCGLTITKNGGAVFKVILDTLRTITVWIISVIIGFESLNPVGKVVLELAGFAFLIMGNLVYNELVVLKFCGLDKNIKKNREKRERERNQEMDDQYERIPAGGEEN